jgi:polyketide biosynthesis acyl carrier protein
MSRDEVERAVRDAITTILPGLPEDQITGDKHLKDLGADSVDRVEIIMALIDRLRLAEPMSRFSAVPDIDALVDVLCQADRKEPG